MNKKFLSLHLLLSGMVLFGLQAKNNNYVPNRNLDYPVDSIFVNRWSPYAFTDEEITDEELFQLFDAARWAPSSYNNQSWRFIYAKKNTPEWQKFLDLLVPFNQTWAQHSSVLLVIASKDTLDFNGKPSVTHSFDTGAAWQNLALQASLMGIATHGMEGFDYAKTREAIKLPDGYTVEAMVAIGRPGKTEDLQEPFRSRNQPTTRKPLDEIVFKGEFSSK